MMLDLLEPFLQENRLAIEIAFGATTVLGIVLTAIRRSFIDTPDGLYRPVFARLKFDEDHDEGAKLRDVEVILTFVVQFARVAWTVLWVCLRASGEAPWWLPAGSEAWGALFLLGLTLELLIFTILGYELVPQVLSVWRGKVISTRTLPTLIRIERVCAPVSRSFRVLRRTLLRIVGNGTEQSEAELAHEGIRAAVEVGEREGLLRAGEKSMIESVLEIQESEIFEVMTPRTDVVAFEASLEIGDAIQRAIDCGHSRIPVYRGDIDHIVGVLYVKDLLRYTSEEDRGTPVEKIVRKINFVPETKNAQELLAEFRANRFHIAVVLDEYGGTSGLVTIEDILEEIVGEIEDEYDSAGSSVIKPIDETQWELDGRAPIDEVSDLLPEPLPENDDYETIAGFLMASLGRVPRPGDSLDHSSARFVVEAADERKVERVRLELEPAPSASNPS